MMHNVICQEHSTHGSHLQGWEGQPSRAKDKEQLLLPFAGAECAQTQAFAFLVVGLPRCLKPG